MNPGQITLSPETYFKLLDLNVRIVDGPNNQKFLDLNDENGTALRYKYFADGETYDTRKVVKIVPRNDEVQIETCEM